MTDSPSDRLGHVLRADFPPDQIRTAADLAAWVLHRALVQHGVVVASDELRLPSRPGPCSWRSHHLDLDFDVYLVSLGRHLIVHSRIAGHPNIHMARIDLVGISPDQAGLEAFLTRHDIVALVDDIILQPIAAQSGRVHQLATQAAALVDTVDAIRMDIVVRDPHELLCIAVHSLFVNENLELVMVDQNPVADDRRLPLNWNQRSDLYRFGYRCPGRISDEAAHVLMSAVPFRTASHLVVTVQSNVGSSDFCGAVRHATVKLSVKRFVDVQMHLRNLHLLISMVYNSISRIAWMPIYDSDCLHLPAWILLLCLSFLDHRDLSRIRSVNPYFRQMCMHPLLWNALYHKQFGSNSDIHPRELKDWRTAFMMRWRQRSRHR